MADSEAYLELLPDGVVVVDADGLVTYANPAAERLARAGRDELAGRPLDEPVALVLGNEAHGLPAEIAADLDLVVRVPLAGRAESLNLAAAAAVLLYEATRTRQEAAVGR